jgi:hypothetical protein
LPMRPLCDDVEALVGIGDGPCERCAGLAGEEGRHSADLVYRDSRFAGVQSHTESSNSSNRSMPEAAPVLTGPANRAFTPRRFEYCGPPPCIKRCAVFAL